MSVKNEKKVKVNLIKKLVEGDIISLGDFHAITSDAEGSNYVIDFEYLDKDSKRESYKITPGFWRISPRDGLIPMDIPEKKYFETQSTKDLLKHLKIFAEKLDIYKKLGLAQKRSILLSSSPGQGKSSTINYFLRKFRDEPGVCALVIDTQDVSYEKIIQMFMDSKPTDAKLVILVIEDIGGSELDERSRHVESDMLNFLDGNQECFKIPTLIVGTTNFINLLGERLIDRPGRFDMIINVEAPKDDEIKILVEGILEREMTESECKALFGKKLSPAYCQEIAIRHLIYDIPLEEASAQISEQRKKSQEKKHGNKNKDLGFS